MNVFPTNNIIRKNNIETSSIPTLLKEYAWNFENDEILLDNGKFIILEGLEALQVRNYLSLKIYKGRFFIYKNKVGTKLKDLRGKTKSYVSLHVQEMLEEALVDGIYVTGIEDIEVDYKDGKLIVGFTVLNIYKDYSEEIKI